MLIRLMCLCLTFFAVNQFHSCKESKKIDTGAEEFIEYQEQLERCRGKSVIRFQNEYNVSVQPGLSIQRPCFTDIIEADLIPPKEKSDFFCIEEGVYFPHTIHENKECSKKPFAFCRDTVYSISISQAGFVYSSDSGKNSCNTQSQDLSKHYEIPRDGLIGEYLLNGNAEDTSGYSRHGTIVGNISLVSNRFGMLNSALSFQGDEAYINLGKYNARNNNSITLSAWIHLDYRSPSMTGQANNYILIKGNDFKYNSFGLMVRDQPLHNSIVYSSNNTNKPKSTWWLVSPESSFTPFNWHHLVAIIDGDVRKIYVDGILRGTDNNAFPIEQSDASFWIGGQDRNDGNGKYHYWFKGRIDDVRIYERVLSNDEILALYNELPEQRLVGNFLMNAGRFLATERIYQSILGIFIGITFSMIFYNVFLGFTINDKIYFIYVLHILSLSLLYITFYGNLREFFDSSNRWLYRALPIFGGFSFLFSSLFTKYFLGLKQFTTLGDRIINASLVIGILFLLSQFFLDIKKSIFVFRVLVFIFAVMSLSIGIYCYQKGNRYARYYCIAEFIYLISIVISFVIIKKIDLNLDNAFMYKIPVFYNIPLVSPAVEMVLLSIALSDRVKSLIQETEESKLINLEQKIKIQESEANRKKLEINLLKKTIQPHFLINTLSTLMGLIIENPKKASRLILKLGQEVRTMLEISSQNTISAQDEIELCHSHLEIMSLRREQNYKLTTNGFTGTERVPPLIFHTLVENAFTHSLRSEEDMTLFLVKKIENGFTLYEFLSPFNEEANFKTEREGTGTKYIKSRLEEIFPNQWDFTQEQNGEYWKICIMLVGTH